jgi:UDP-glucose 4-epimerase
MITNILISGGAGFIGSHLCEELSKNPLLRLTSLDDYSTGTINNHIDGVNYIIGETRNIENLIDFSPDVVFHLGEYSRVEQSFEDIENVWKSNKDGIFAVLQFCVKNKSKLIYAGSSTKFGDKGSGRSQSPYAWTKASNTELVVNYGKWFGLEYAITYFYNVYGGREISTGKYATLIALFVEKYKNKEPLTVVKPGTQLRNFTHIDDIINGLIMVGEKGSGDNYGIGFSKSYSIFEIAQMFESEIKMLPERKGNRMSADVVCKKTLALGWTETKSIVDYIDNIKRECKYHGY